MTWVRPHTERRPWLNTFLGGLLSVALAPWLNIGSFALSVCDPCFDPSPLIGLNLLFPCMIHCINKKGSCLCVKNSRIWSLALKLVSNIYSSALMSFAAVCSKALIMLLLIFCLMSPLPHFSALFILVINLPRKRKLVALLLALLLSGGCLIFSLLCCDACRSGICGCGIPLSYSFAFLLN